MESGKQDDMAFDTQGEFLEEPQPDLELLEMQKRKSVPHFVVSEFVEQMDDVNDASSEEDMPEVKQKEPSFKKPRLEKQPSVHVEVTHVDVKNIQDLETKGEGVQIGLHEFSPLEKAIQKEKN